MSLPVLDLDAAEPPPPPQTRQHPSWRRLTLACAVLAVLAGLLGSALGARSALRAAALAEPTLAVASLTVPEPDILIPPPSGEMRLQLRVTNLGDEPFQVRRVRGGAAGLGPLHLPGVGPEVAGSSSVDLEADTTLDCRRRPRSTGYEVLVTDPVGRLSAVAVDASALAESELCTRVRRGQQSTSQAPGHEDVVLESAQFDRDSLRLRLRLSRQDQQLIGFRVDGSTMPVLGGQQRSGHQVELVLGRPRADCLTVANRGTMSATVELTVTDDHQGVHRVDAPVGPELPVWLAEGYATACPAGLPIGVPEE